MERWELESPMPELRILQRALDCVRAAPTKSAVEEAMEALGEAAVATFDSDLEDLVQATILLELLNLRPKLATMLARFGDWS